MEIITISVNILGRSIPFIKEPGQDKPGKYLTVIHFINDNKKQVFNFLEYKQLQNKYDEKVHKAWFFCQ